MNFQGSNGSIDVRASHDGADQEEAGGLAIWAQVRRHLLRSVDRETFDKWISSVVFVAEVDGEIVLAADSVLVRDRVSRDYWRKIEQAWALKDPRRRSIRLKLLADLPSHLAELVDHGARVTTDDDQPDVADINEADPSVDEDDDLTGDDAYAQSFDTYVVGKCNEIAASIARKVAMDVVGPVSVILFYGDHGVGKTHLMQAIRHEKSKRTGRDTVVYMSAEDFMLTFVEGVKNKDTGEQRRRIRKASVVLLDDLQFLLSRKGSMAEFFSHLRFVTEHGGKVVLSADAAPTRLEILDSRIRDEIQGGVVAKIERPGRVERAAIIQSKIDIIAREFPGFELKKEWVDMIADRMPASGRALYGAVRNVFAGTVLADRPVTEASVEAAIRLQVGERRSPKLETIKDVVARHYGMTKADLESPNRRQALARARQVAMYLSRELTNCSYPQIAYVYGKRDHTTILYGYRKINKLLKSDAGLVSEVEALTQSLLDDPRNIEAG